MKKRVVLYDIDSRRIPNLALMKLCTFYHRKGFDIILSKSITYIKADRYFASAVFYKNSSQKKIMMLRKLYGDDIEMGGSGISLKRRLDPEVERCFPNYQLYNHNRYAVGFLTRGCNYRCGFCLVPRKEGKLRRVSGFDDFVPPGQKNVMLLDDNLLSSPHAESILSKMISKQYAINFNQSLDIRYLNEENFRILRRIDYRNSRFTKKMIYFSCDDVRTVKQFMKKKHFLNAFGEDAVTVIAIFGFDTHLSEDYERFLMIRRLRLIPFFQKYFPIRNVPNRVPKDFFDMDLNDVIHLTFRSNGQNWEKYLRWLNRFYFQTFGKYYLPLIKIIYRYNHKERINRYLQKPHLLTMEMYRSYV